MQNIWQRLWQTGSEITSDPVCKDPHIYVKITDTLKNYLPRQLAILKNPETHKTKIN